MSIFEKNKGTSTDPFKIYTEDDLIELTNYGDLINPDLHYQLQNDIHLVKEWVKGIGNTLAEAFAGTFDGNGYKISNLYNSSITGSYFALFVYTKGATIKNLEVDGVNFSTRGNFNSGLVGISNSGTLNIINTAVKNVEINITDSSRGRASAFVGTCNGGHANIKNSYAQNVKITRASSFSEGAGVIVGYIQNRNVSVENVFIFGDIFLYTPQKTYNKVSRLDYGDLNGGSFSGNLIQATTSSTHNLSGSQRTETPLVKDSYPSTISFGPQQAWDMIDGELPFLTYLGTRVNPRKLGEESDLSMLGEYPYDHFKLIDDIEIVTRYSEIAFNNDFYGVLDGDGYRLYGIDIYSTAIGPQLSLFGAVYGVIKNIEFNFKRVQNTHGSSRGTTSTVCRQLYGELDGVRVIVEGALQGDSVRLIVGTIYDGAKVINSYGQASSLTTRNSLAYLIGASNSSADVYVENNVLKVNSLPTSHASQIVPSTSSNVRNNIIYFTSGTFPVREGRGTATKNLSNFQNGNHSMYNSFDKDIWVFRDGEDPIQSVFIKITEKIEERLISLYSKGMYLESRWTKGFKNILKFFTNKSGSSTRTKRSPFRRLLSFTKDISLKMLFKKKGRKRVKSNSGLVVSNITKLKKLTETILGYSNKITSNYSKIKSGAKILEIYSDKVSFRTIETKKSLKKAVNYSKGIRDNLLKKITRRHNRKTQSFSRNIGSDVFHSYLTRVTEKVMSYSGHMRSIIRRASNKYDFEFRMVSNQANKITIRFRRFIRTMRTTRSYSGMMTTFVRRLSRISAPSEIFARAVARTNSVRMKVKESFTKIKASNGGGD